MVFEFKLPDLGEGIHEADIISLKIKEGQTVKENEPIMEVETDKALVEIPCPLDGVVQTIHVSESQKVKVGMTMITFIEKSQVNQIASSHTTNHKASQTAETAQATQVDITQSVTQKIMTPPAKIGAHRVLAAPSTRRMARELNLDISLIVGTGPSGRVLKTDLNGANIKTQPTKSDNSTSTLPHTLSPSAPLTAANQTFLPKEHVVYNMPEFEKYGPIDKQPLKSVRAKIAEHMALSWARIPHVSHFDEVEISELNSVMNNLQNAVSAENIKLTLTAFAVKAVTKALIKFPEFNSTLNEATNEIILKKYYNIGIAVATDRGLLVPVLYNTNQKSLKQIAIELNDLVYRTRNNKIKPDELQGGTFTITNIGVIGGTSMSPMVNYPECAILGLATSKQTPIVKDNQIVIGNMLPLALSFDHRITDGANAAYFIQYFKSLIGYPSRMLLE